jgi:cytochrome c553
MTGSKLGLVVLLAVPIVFRPGVPRPAAPDSPAPAPEAAAKSEGSFTATVRPVLAAKCAPCHEPGGKMYGSLPFDKAETISSHREGVLKRLQGDDRAAVEKWLATLPPSH